MEIKCDCKKKIKIDDKKLIQYYISGKKTIKFKCDCKKEYDVRIFLDLSYHIGQIDCELEDVTE